MLDKQTVLEHYLIAALWSSTDDEGDPLDDNYDTDDVSESLRAESMQDVEAFLETAGNDLEGLDSEQVGHDLWLTRNGHGAGFWDRGLGERGERLTELCKPFGEVYLYVGDDGKVYGVGDTRSNY